MKEKFNHEVHEEHEGSSPGGRETTLRSAADTDELIRHGECYSEGYSQGRLRLEEESFRTRPKAEAITRIDTKKRGGK